MTPAQLKKKLSYWMDKFHLGHWLLTLHIVDESDEMIQDSAWAKVEVDPYYEKMEMWFTFQNLERNDYEVEVTIVHELFHVLMRDYDAVWEHIEDSNILGAPLNFVYGDRFEKAGEALTDKVARIMVSMDRE